MKDIAIFLAEEIEKNNHLGIQVYIQKNDEVLLHESYGFKDNMQNYLHLDDKLYWLSCSKMIASIAVAILVDEGKIHPKLKVGDFLPEFANKGKEEISIADILTHRAGIGNLVIDWSKNTYQEILYKIYDMQITKDWQIGKTAGYDPLIAWIVLKELIEKVTNISYKEFVEEKIFQVLNMQGAEILQESRLENSCFYTYEDGWQETFKEYFKRHNECKIGSNICGSIQDLALFMQSLDSCFKTQSLISDDTKNLFLQPSRIDSFDRTFLAKIDWSLGFMFDSKKYQKKYAYNFGSFCSSDTFGHHGKESSTAYIDRKNNLLVCFACNSMLGEKIHQGRILELNNLIYQTLKLA